MPTLTNVAPNSGPPGTAITVTGTGLVAGARVCCPAPVDTAFVSATQLTAAIPPDILGPGGANVVIDVYVENPDGSKSAMLPFTVIFDALLQSFTTVDKIASEVPGFKRAGRISDATIDNWSRSIAQSIIGVLLARGLTLDPAKWQTPAGTGMPAPSAVLELINRLGAGAQLAAAVASDFSQGEWGLAKALERRYQAELKRLEGGDYDKLFNPAAATKETAPQLAVGDIQDDQGNAEQAFSKTKVF